MTHGKLTYLQEEQESARARERAAQLELVRRALYDDDIHQSGNIIKEGDVNELKESEQARIIEPFQSVADDDGVCTGQDLRPSSFDRSSPDDLLSLVRH